MAPRHGLGSLSPKPISLERDLIARAEHIESGEKRELGGLGRPRDNQDRGDDLLSVTSYRVVG